MEKQGKIISFIFSTFFVGLIIFEILQLWISPRLDQGEAIYTLATLMVIEFFLVHSGVFMVVIPSALIRFLFIPIYGLFVFVFSMSVPGNSIFYLYLFIVFQRMVEPILDRSIEMRNVQIFTASLNASLYFFLMVIIAPNHEKIPVLGLTPTFLDESNYLALAAKTGGVFLDTPNVAFAFGLFFYLGQIGISYFINFKVDVRKLDYASINI